MPWSTPRWSGRRSLSCSCSRSRGWNLWPARADSNQAAPWCKVSNKPRNKARRGAFHHAFHSHGHRRTSHSHTSPLPQSQRNSAAQTAPVEGNGQTKCWAGTLHPPTASCSTTRAGWHGSIGQRGLPCSVDILHSILLSDVQPRTTREVLRWKALVLEWGIGSESGLTMVIGHRQAADADNLK